MSRTLRFRVEKLIRDRQKISQWQAKELRVCAIAAENSEHRSFGAMARIAAGAKVAHATAGVDFSNNSATD